MSNSGTKLLTARQLAKTLGVSRFRVEYVLRTHKSIRPAAQAGTCRMYDRAAVARIRDELDAIDLRRPSRLPLRAGLGLTGSPPIKIRPY